MAFEFDLMASSDKPNPPGASDFQDIIHEKNGSTTIIYLNRPEKRNAMTRRMVEELRKAFWMIESDRGIRVVVMAAKGKSYCAGGDTSEFLSNTIEQTEAFQIENPNIRSGSCGCGAH